MRVRRFYGPITLLLIMCILTCSVFPGFAHDGKKRIFTDLIYAGGGSAVNHPGELVSGVSRLTVYNT